MTKWISKNCRPNFSIPAKMGTPLSSIFDFLLKTFSFSCLRRRGNRRRLVQNGRKGAGKPPETSGWLVQNGREGGRKMAENRKIKLSFYFAIRRPENGGWLVQLPREGAGKVRKIVNPPENAGSLVQNGREGARKMAENRKIKLSFYLA